MDVLQTFFELVSAAVLSLLHKKIPGKDTREKNYYHYFIRCVLGSLYGSLRSARGSNVRAKSDVVRILANICE